MSDDCIFCQIIEKKIPSTIEYEDAEVIAFRDINPQAPVHLLVLPKKHIARITEIKPEDYPLMGKLIAVSNDLARKHRIHEKGFRVAINCEKDGGQAVYHIHLHLLGGRRLQWPPG